MQALLDHKWELEAAHVGVGVCELVFGPLQTSDIHLVQGLTDSFNSPKLAKLKMKS